LKFRTGAHYFNRPGPSSRIRRSAIKARKSITTRGAKDTLEQTDKTIQTVKRRRKQRHAKLKEMAKEEEEGTLGESWLDKFNGVEIVCPVCSTTVRGDQDVVNAHVDACVAHESLVLEGVRQRALQYRRAIEDAAWDDGDDDSFGNYVGNLRGELLPEKIMVSIFMVHKELDSIGAIATRKMWMTRLISKEMTKQSMGRCNSQKGMYFPFP
jgi:hypothetical protein